MCPVTSITYDTVTRQECDLCIEPCYTCEGTTSTCTSCITGFYFHENECVSECPSGYEVSEDQTCYRASEFILPFITMAGPLIFLFAVAISNCVDKRTKPITAFMALQSSYMIGFWIYQIAFLVKDSHNSSPILIAFALLCNYAINCVFYEFAKSRILHGKDKMFAQYTQEYKSTQKLVLTWSMLTSF